MELSPPFGCIIFTTMLQVLGQDLKYVTHAARVDSWKSWMRMGLGMQRGGKRHGWTGALSGRLPTQRWPQMIKVLVGRERTPLRGAAWFSPCWANSCRFSFSAVDGLEVPIFSFVEFEWRWRKTVESTARAEDICLRMGMHRFCTKYGSPR